VAARTPQAAERQRPGMEETRRSAARLREEAGEPCARSWAHSIEQMEEDRRRLEHRVAHAERRIEPLKTVHKAASEQDQKHTPHLVDAGRVIEVGRRKRQDI